MFVVKFLRFIPTTKRKNKRAIERIYASYCVDADNYRDALEKSAVACVYFTFENPGVYQLYSLHPVQECDVPSLDKLPDFPEKFEDYFYRSKYCYDVMVTEGSRLLNIKSNGETDNYGTLVRNNDTMEMTYACANGKLYSDEEIKKLKWNYFPEEIFNWKPILFPYTADKKIDLTDYIHSDFKLSFIAQNCRSEQFEKQIEWIMEQEGLT